MKTSKITAISLPGERLALLRALARAEGHSVSGLIRDLIEEALQARRVKNHELGIIRNGDGTPTLGYRLKPR